MKFDAVIVAAGKSERAAGNKMEFVIGNDTVLSRAAGVFYGIKEIERIVLVVRKDEIDFAQSVISEYDASRFRIVIGGESRSQSVRNGLEATVSEGVLIHDGARPFVSEKTVFAVMNAVEQYGSGVPALPVNDSVRSVKDGVVTGAVEREGLYAVQTPQGFRRDEILKAFAAADGKEYADESLLYSERIAPAHIVDGEERNVKITTRGDYGALNSRVGIGYDVHTLAPFRKLVIGGIEIAHEMGSVAHSDGDMAIHALIDALLAAIGESDIGTHFPPDDPKYLDADSSLMLTDTVELCKRANYKIVSCSIIIIAEKPKLADYIPVMRVKIANLLGVTVSDVSIAAKTNEGVGEIGKGRAIAAYASAVVC